MDQTMRETFDVLDQISRVSSRNTKVELLHRLRHNEFAKFYFETIFNPYLTYGTSVTGEKVPMEGEVTPTALRNIRTTLIERKCTGDAARVLVNATCSTPDAVLNKWIKLMWERNLRIGISWSAIEKVFPGLIPQFNLALCDKIRDNFLNQDWIIEPKYDGSRCVFIFDEQGKCVASLSRNGKELFNVDHIKAELESMNVSNMVLDGEIYGKDWNETASVTRSSVAKVASEIKFYVFDAIPMSEWKAQKGTTKLMDRKNVLTALFDNREVKYVINVPWMPAISNERAWENALRFKDIYGYEGAVAKNLESVYGFDRSTNWLKMKFEESEDIEVIGVEAGLGKNANRMGALVCKLPNGSTVKCGGGFTDVQRDELWINKPIGKIIEVKFQEKTKDGSLRFPVFVRMREDKEVIK